MKIGPRGWTGGLRGPLPVKYFCVIVSDKGVHGEKKVRWDEPVFGVTEGWVSWPLLELDKEEV